MSPTRRDVHDELLSVLVRFKPEQLRSHAIKDFPEVDWTTVRELVDRCREKHTSKVVAAAIVRIVKKIEFSEEEVRDKIENLRLRAFGLATNKTWFAYELISEQTNAARPCTVNETPIHEIVQHVGSDARASVVALPFCFEGYESILMSIDRRRPVILCLNGDRLLTVNKFSNNDLLDIVAKGLGFDKIKYCDLSGHHIPSLLRILDEKSRIARSQLVSLKPAYDNRPRHNRHGLDFTTEEPLKEYLHEWLGDEKDRPILSDLTAQINAKLPNDRLIKSKITLKSSNVENSLRDMAAVGIVSPNSVFFSMLNKYGKNNFKIKMK